MDCTHETPGGSRYCALCRHEVLAQHAPRHRTWVPMSGDRPMPSTFRDMIRRASATQPTLNLED